MGNKRNEEVCFKGCFGTAVELCLKTEFHVAETLPKSLCLLFPITCMPLRA